jgi:tetratricopeptide (TPR) repeat protein
MTVMSAFGGAPVASMTLTCVIARVEGEPPHAATQLASARHAANNRLIPDSLTRVFDDAGFRAGHPPAQGTPFRLNQEGGPIAAGLGYPGRVRQWIPSKLNPNLAVGHFALARFLMGDYDIPGSEKELCLSLEIDPELAGALDPIALFEAFRGEFTQSIETYQRVVTLDPVNPQRYFKPALVYYYAGRFQESIAAEHSMRELQPDSDDPAARN